MLSVLHIEDIDYYCDFVRNTLRGCPGIFYLGAAATAVRGLALCERLSPDAVLLDLGLPDLDGIEVARRLSALCIPPRVIALTAHTEPASLYRVGHSLIAGMIEKDLPAPELRSALQAALEAVAAGRTYFSTKVRASIQRLRQAPDAFPKILTARQLDLLPLLGYGLTNDEIAARVGASPRAVQAHRQRIMASLGLHRSGELMRWCAHQGFSDPSRLAPPCATAR